MPLFPVLNSLSSMTSVLLLVSCLALSIVYYLRKKYSYWERRGVPCSKSISFLFSNTKDLVLRRVPLAFVFQRIYNELDGHKFGGFYQMTNPALMIRDPELIRSIFVKNFSYFHDRNAQKIESLSFFSPNLLNLTGQRWRNVRYKLTPAFSSGKLKAMQGLMQECITELADYLDKALDDDCKNPMLNVREIMAKFTTDVIGACAFGLNCNSIRDENSEFRRIGRIFTKTTLRMHIRVLLRSLSPTLTKLIGLGESNPEVMKFFWTALKDAVRHRESNTYKRSDFLQVLIDIQAEEIKQKQNINDQDTVTNEIQNGFVETQKDILFTDSVVVSNAFTFFIAGYETIAITLSHCLYELALHPDIFMKLRDEVESVKQGRSKNLDYDALKELVYMDAVISETLRKYPVASVLARRCTETTQLPNTSVVVEEGVNLFVSIYALHHDPKYFPEPEKFKPERFIGENKDNIVPGSYLPFGDGPRICIGMRFAMYEMKSVLSYIVSNYTIHTCEKTSIPLKYDPKPGLHTPCDVWVRFQKRAKS
ncbi:unnamed protein product [Bemisia tabaci]|uniref:Cytochrome P450 n=3 Tax=Bemisia tabaci TaxID=7038 RepID=A0A9P0AK59_BEMTA|nr:unnamed protein product [Bemisia tabaci]